MFTEEARRKKNWRSKVRALRKARNKVEKLKAQIAGERYTLGSLPALKASLQDAEIRVSVLELQVGDKPE